jgi:hypothetical protein
LAHALTWSIFLKFHGLAASAEAVFPKLNKRANKIKELMRNQTERETRLMALFFQTKLALTVLTVMILRSSGDNHCQEDGQAKSAWRETRVIWGNWINSSSLPD